MSSAQSAMTPGRANAQFAKSPGSELRRNLSKTNDRFIPSRSATDFTVTSKENSPAADPNTQDYTDMLARNLSGNADSNARVLAFKKKAPRPSADQQSELSVLYTANRSGPAINKKAFRHISQTPERILDAPDMMDDYYLNLLDWSSQNTLAVALGQAVYLWNASDGTIDLLMEMEDEEDYVSSVSWTADGAHLAVGTGTNATQIWDIARGAQLRSMDGHSARVSSMSWNQHLLSTGSKDSTIVNHDVRVQGHAVSTLRGHDQEVCGLKWSPDGTQLASGGNDNIVNIWEPGASGTGSTAPVHRFSEHQAAVKALAWCPWQDHLLATGGGTADRCIRFWDTQAGRCKNTINTKSQVCSLLWSKHEKEIISSHGFSQNQLCVWSYPKMTKMAELTGHTSRVLHLAASPDGETVVSGAADETLRFWKAFAPAEAKSAAAPSMRRTHSTTIR